LHQMARSGGTVICRCLASMQNIVLLSEIHPLGVQMFNPLQQAAKWYGLLTSRDLARVKNGNLTFLQSIQLITSRCAEQGLILVLRDWSHLDYTGVPFVRPGFRPRLVEALQPAFTVLRLATVRHPLDQWLSLSQNPVFRDTLGPARFLTGYRRFAKIAAVTGFLRYEDFTADPEAGLRDLCIRLRLPFDPGYRDRWMGYTRITGDVLPGRAGEEITPLPPRYMDESEELRFCSLPGYSASIALLGYTARNAKAAGPKRI